MKKKLFRISSIIIIIYGILFGDILIFEIGSGSHVVFTISSLFIITLFPFVIIYHKLKFHVISFFFIVYLILLSLSVINATRPLSSLGVIYFLILDFLSFTVTFSILKNTSDIEPIVKSYIAWPFILLVWILIVISMSEIPFILQWTYKSIEIPLGKTNYLAGFVVLVAPFLLYNFLFFFFQETFRIKCFFYLIAYCTCCSIILILNSKGGLLGLLISFGYMIFRFAKVSARIRISLLSGTILFIIILSLALDYISADLFQELSLVDKYQRSVSQRTELWNYYIQKFIDHPLIGCGLGDNRFEVYGLSSGESQYVGAHNMFLQTLGDSGIIGFSALILLLFSIRKSISLPKKILDIRIAFIAGFYGFIAHSNFELLWYSNSFGIFLWTYIAIFVFYERQIRLGAINRIVPAYQNTNHYFKGPSNNNTSHHPAH